MIMERNRSLYKSVEDTNLWSVILNRRDNLGNLDVDGFVILHFLWLR